jgi:putative flippase GtrA
MAQFGKFFIVGVLNTIIDLGVLAVLTIIMGTPLSSLEFAACKIISFSCALINSYFLNKYWVFRSDAHVRSAESGITEKARFAAVSSIGLIINTIFASVAFRIGSEVVSDMHLLVVEIAGLVGTAAALTWNFVGYKFIVFKKINYEHTSFSNRTGIQGVEENRGNAPKP